MAAFQHNDGPRILIPASLRIQIDGPTQASKLTPLRPMTVRARDPQHMSMLAIELHGKHW